MKTSFREARQGVYSRANKVSFEKLIKDVFENSNLAKKNNIELEGVSFKATSSKEGSSSIHRGEFRLRLVTQDKTDHFSVEGQVQWRDGEYIIRLVNLLDSELQEVWSGFMETLNDTKEFEEDLKDIIDFCVDYKEDRFEDRFEERNTPYKRSTVRESQRKKTKQTFRERADDISKKNRTALREAFYEYVDPDEFMEEDFDEHQDILRNLSSVSATEIASRLGANKAAEDIIDQVIEDWSQYDIPVEVVMDTLQERLGLTEEEREEVQAYFEEQPTVHFQEAAIQAPRKRSLRERKEKRNKTSIAGRGLDRRTRALRESWRRENGKRTLREGYLMSPNARFNPHRDGLSPEEQDRLTFAREMFSKVSKL